MMTITAPTFLYPTSRQFPFDEVCEQIVRGLEARNWDVPGITVTFYEYGSGDAKYRKVDTIKGDDFKLWFCRVQGSLGSHWNDTAAVTDLVIPGKELNVYEDESGPTLNVWVGKDWEQDRDRFMKSGKVNSKLHGEPRWYLQYKGAWEGPYIYPNRRPPYLKHDNDLGREYDTKLGEPKRYTTSSIFDEFTSWLHAMVLVPIQNRPVPQERIDVFHQEAAPFPQGLGPIFCFGEGRDADRVHQGKLDPSELEPGNRYGLPGSGYRLLSLDVRRAADVPEIAWDGFLWCGVGAVDRMTSITDLTVPGHYRWSDKERFVFRVTPNRADGVYVADQAPYEQRRKELWRYIEAGEPDRRELNHEEIADFNNARARTIVPITEYDGSYTQPIVLINRELGFDEVELVSGPWPECQYVLYVSRHSAEASDLLADALRALKAYHSGYNRDVLRPFDTAVADLARLFTDDAELARLVETHGLSHGRAKISEHFFSQLVYAASDMRDYGLF